MQFLSTGVNQTIKLGKKVAQRLQPDDIICLVGELGSGKTVFTKGLAFGLGVKKSEVVSPSFVLIRQYCKAKFPLYHFDLYRLKNQAQILSLGYEEYLSRDGVCVIEWADRLGRLSPKEFLKIDLAIKGKTKRLFKFSAFGQHYQDLLNNICSELKHKQ